MALVLLLGRRRRLLRGGFPGRSRRFAALFQRLEFRRLLSDLLAQLGKALLLVHQVLAGFLDALVDLLKLRSPLRHLLRQVRDVTAGGHFGIAGLGRGLGQLLDPGLGRLGLGGQVGDALFGLSRFGVSLLDGLSDLGQFLLPLLDFSRDLLVLLGCDGQLTLGVLKLLTGAGELVVRVGQFLARLREVLPELVELRVRRFGLLTGLRRLIGLGRRFLAQRRDAVAKLGFLLANFRHALGDLLRLGGALGDLGGEGFKLLTRGALLLTGFAKLSRYTLKLLSLLTDLLRKLVSLLLRFGALLLNGLGLRLGRFGLGVQVLQLLLAGLDFLAQPIDFGGQPLLVLHGGAQPLQVALDGLALIPCGIALAGEGCNCLLIFSLTLGELLFQVAALDPERDCRYHRDDRHHGQSQQIISQVSPAPAGFVRAGHGYPL